jgi:hypothetical protein
MGRLIWLLPPLLGLLAFGVFRSLGGPRPAAEPAVAAVDPGSLPTDDQRDVAGLLEEFETEWSALERSEKLAVLGLDSAALRARLLELKKKFDTLPDDTDWDVRVRMIESLKSMARELGKRQQGEAWLWILETMPDLRTATTGGWAESGPDAALEAVIACARPMPCEVETLMKLLQHQADQSEAALTAACAAVSWDLFLEEPMNPFSGDPFGEAFTFPRDGDLRPWLHSGVLEKLAREGVEVRNVYATWARQDPADALARLDSFPDLLPPEPGRRIGEILQAGTDQPQHHEAIRAALVKLPPADLTEIVNRLGEYHQFQPEHANQLMRLYPMLVAPDE